MKCVLFFIIIFNVTSLPQSTKLDLSSKENILKFADYLFCERDYLRAVNEYDRFFNNNLIDTLYFKTGLAFLKMGDYSNSQFRFSAINKTSLLYPDAQLQKLKVSFVIEDYIQVRKFFTTNCTLLEPENMNRAKKLNNISFLFTQESLPAKNDFLIPFTNSEKIEVEKFYSWKSNPPYKSEVLAGIMSAIIPGSGKMYADEWGDGITAFIVTGLFAFLAYDNFRANHNTRAWIFTTLGAFFYAGNIYGSVAATQIYNARISFEFNDGLNLYLEHKNYFLPEYNFCE